MSDGVYDNSGIHITDYGTGREPVGQTWTTAQLREEFDVIEFRAPFVTVTRKSDGVKGSLEFRHSPRVYFDFRVYP